MTRFFVRRVAWTVVSLIGVSLITFGLGVLSPGDPAEGTVERRLNQPPPVELVKAERRVLGLDRPITQQYLTWLGRAFHGDFGTSWLRGVRVSEVLAERARPTAALAGTAGLLSVLIGVPIGLLGAVRRNSLADHLCRIASLTGASVPSYFLAYLLILLFAVRLRLLPVYGFGSTSHLVLPAVTLALGPASTLVRLTRSSVLETVSQDFIRTARSKGLNTARIFCLHALRNSLVPILTAIGLSIGRLLAGTIAVETVFAWPGLGDLTVNAIRDHDYPLIQGVVLLSGTVYVVVNFVVDVSYGWADPRVRAGASRGTI